MNERIIAVVILGLALLVSLYNVMAIPDWDLLDNWAKVTVGANVLSIVGIFLLGIWVYKDYEDFNIGQLTTQNRISKLEEVVDNNCEFIDKRLKTLEEHNKE